ncbi:MAG: hypothetical protein ABI639_03950 [Thermoanaerobaculia bacterium]
MRTESSYGRESHGAYRTSFLQLTPGEVLQLVSDIADSGLDRFDPKSLAERDRRDLRMRGYVSDAGAEYVSISLLRRQGLWNRSTEVVRNQFWLDGSTLGLLMEGQDVPEMEALRRIQRLQSSLRQKGFSIDATIRPSFEFSFPNDRRPVAVFSARDERTLRATALKVYASGTVELESSSFPNGRELQLPIDIRDRILQDVQDGDLTHYDEVALASQRRNLDSARRPVKAQPANIFTGKLRLRPASGPPGTNTWVEISVLDSSGLATRYPSIAAYKALSDLENLIWEAASFASNLP